MRWEKNAHHDVVAAIGRAAMAKIRGTATCQRESRLMNSKKQGIPTPCAIHSNGTKTSGREEPGEFHLIERKAHSGIRHNRTKSA